MLCNIRHNFFVLISFVLFISISACGGGSTSGGTSNSSPSAPMVLGVLPNGSSVVISSGTFNVVQGGGSSGAISIGTGRGNTAYMPTFSTSASSGPIVSVTPDSCTLSPSNTSCQILINPNGAQLGSYSITPIFTPVGAGGGSIKNKTQPQSSTTLNSFTVIVSSAGDISTGTLAVTLSATNITAPNTMSGSVILSNSAGVNDISVVVSSNDISVASVTPTSCILSSVNPVCPISVTGVASGSTSIKVSAGNYTAQDSAIFTVNSALIPGNLELTLTPSNILLSESALATVSLVGSSGISGLDVNLGALSGSLVNLSAESCVLSSNRPSCSIVLTANSESSGVVPIVASALGYTSATANLTITSLWVKLTGQAGQPSNVLNGPNGVFGSPVPSAIVMQDSARRLWTYNESVWESQSGALGQPTRAAEVYGSPTPISIVLRDDGSRKLWTYNGLIWDSQTGGANQPADIVSVFGSPTPTSIVMSDNVRRLWTYNGVAWEVQSGGANQPTSVFQTYGSPTPTAIVALAESRSLWVFNGVIWESQTGGINQPPSVNGVYGSATPTSIVLVDDANPHKLWTYNGSVWTGKTGGVNQPAAVDRVYASPTPDSIIIKESATPSGKLWTYNGIVWESQTGGVNQPPSVSTVYTSSTPSSIVMMDNANPRKLWTYDGTAWTSQTGGANQPAGIGEVYASPAPTAIVMTDNANPRKLWTYDGTAWTSQTGGANQPPNLSGAILGGSVSNVATPTSIVMKDGNSTLWAYNGINWTQLSGLANQPESINSLYGSPSPNSIVVSDRSNNLWTYFRN